MKYEVFIEVFGITCDKLTQLGEFTLNLGVDLISKVTNLAKPLINNNSCYLSIEVVANNEKDAVLLSKRKFTDFKKLLDFTCGRNNKVSAVNLFYQIPNYQRYILPINSEMTYSQDIMNIGYIPIVHSIDEFIAEMKINGQLYIWDLYSKKNKNSKENRLINAILWIGKAHSEEDNKIKLMEYCFAIESLLQMNVDTFINPSITYSISNYCAIIIAQKYEDRKIVIKHIKDLYTKRSKIAHGKNVEITDTDCETLYLYLVYLIVDLVKNKPWADFTTMEDVCKEVESIMLGKVTKECD